MNPKKKKIDQFSRPKENPITDTPSQSGLITGQSQQPHDSKNESLSELDNLNEKFNLVLNQGLYYRASLSDVEKLIAGPIICLASLVYEDERGCYARQYQLTDADGKDRKVDIPIEWFAGDGKKVEELLLKLNFRHARNRGSRNLLIQYLSQVKPKTSIIVYDRTGWNESAFRLPHQSIGTEQNARFIGDHEATQYGTNGTLEGWQTACKSCETNSRLAIALFTAFAAPLLAIGHIDNFGLHFAGPSSIGKTTSLKVAGSVFGNPDKYLLTWRATSNALESVATAHNDTLLVLDEIGQASVDLGETVYMLFNGQSKKRMKKDCNLRKSESWRLIALSSGEQTLEDHVNATGKKVRAGQEVRFITINADAEKGFGILDDLQGEADSNKFVHTLLESLSINYGLAGISFIRNLIEHKAVIHSEIKERIKAHKASLLKEFKSPAGQVIRVAEKFALLIYAGDLAIKYGILPFAQSVPFATCQRLFNEWIDVRGGEGELEAAQIIEHLQTQCEVHQEKFVASIERYGRESWGFIWHGGLYLTKGGLISLFRGFNVNAVKKVLLKSKIIKSTQADRKTIFSQSVRVFELNLQVLENKTSLSSRF